MTICPFVWTQYRRWTDRQNNRQMDNIGKNNNALCMHCMLTRDKYEIFSISCIMVYRPALHANHNIQFRKRRYK